MLFNTTLATSINRVTRPVAVIQSSSHTDLKCRVTLLKGICLSVSVWFIWLSACLLVCMFVCLSLSARLSVCLSTAVCLSVCCLCQFVCLSVCLFVCLTVSFCHGLSICWSVEADYTKLSRCSNQQVIATLRSRFE